MDSNIDYRIERLAYGVTLTLLLDDRQMGMRICTSMDEAVAVGCIWLNADLEDRPLEQIATELCRPER